MGFTPTSGNAATRPETEHKTPTEAINDLYDWPAEEVDGIVDLYYEIRDADSLEDWDSILDDHLTWGNNKIAKHVGIFNMNSATDCPNIGTEFCQVDENECYAYGSENQYPNALPYRRRQEYVWDHIDAMTFADAFKAKIDRKHIEATALRFNQAGDFRHGGDIVKADRIARQLEEVDIDVYTYSASSYLDWSQATAFTINQSNARGEYGDRHFSAVPDGLEPEDIEFLDDNAVQCPSQYTDGEIDCGDCRLCIDAEGPDVYIRPH